MSCPRRLLPQAIEDMADLKRVGPVLLLGLAALIYIQGRLHNGWSYLVPSAVGPLLASLFFAWRPTLFIPPFARREETTQERTDLSGRAAHFIELLKSRRAKRILLLTGASTSTCLCSAIWLILLLRRESLEWTLNLGSLLPLTFLFGLWSMTLHYHFLVRWIFRSSTSSPG